MFHPLQAGQAACLERKQCNMCSFFHIIISVLNLFVFISEYSLMETIQLSSAYQSLTPDGTYEQMEISLEPRS